MTKKSAVITKKELSKRLKELPAWKCNAKETQLYRTFSCSSQVDGLVLIARITVHAELLQHVPEIRFSKGKVKVILTTPELKGISTVDIILAERIDRFMQKVDNKS